MVGKERSGRIAADMAPYSDRLLLTGAGFSKDWGGYLASEIWSVIMGAPRIRTRPHVDRLLHRNLNFEDALAEAELTKPGRFSNEDRRVLRQAVMNAFEVQDSRIRSWDDRNGLLNALMALVEKFATRSGTKTLFTLNQDLLLERSVLSGDAPRIEVPGVPAESWWFGRETRTAAAVHAAKPVHIEDKPSKSFRDAKGKLAYIKLHGSMNWRRPRGDVVVLGGAKEQAIKQFRILRINTAVFRAALKQPGARMLVIGYGFADAHINQNIASGVAEGLKLWIVDPRSPESIRSNLKQQGMTSIWKAVIGYSPGPWIKLFDRLTTDYRLLEEGFWT